MQEFKIISPTDFLRDSREDINKNFQSIATDFSGDTFPTQNLWPGMKCYRTDQSKVYQLQADLATWKQIYDYSGAEITVPKANKAVLDGDGNPIKTTYLKSVPVYTGATTSAAGAAGLVKAPGITDREKFLKGNGEWAEVPKLTKLDLLDMIYPVGSIYMSVNSSNPGSLFGGTWEAYAQGRVLIGAGTGTDSRSEQKIFAAGSTGGEYNHQLTVWELAQHNHSASAGNGGAHTHVWYTGQYGSDNDSAACDAQGAGNHYSQHFTQWADPHSHSVSISNTGSNAAHNNMQPYLTVYIWRRTA